MSKLFAQFFIIKAKHFFSKNTFPTILDQVKQLTTLSIFFQSKMLLQNEQCVRFGNFCKTCRYSYKFDIMQFLSCIDNQLYQQSLDGQNCKRTKYQIVYLPLKQIRKISLLIFWTISLLLLM
ncbi:unnamed protein product [Paramecium octaurelia]|uniref:Uncharacterized protein n=1 Tax=Paramecium octaurelia TaxID=43137 RepID=A0A8S1W0E5_PAROT|nr:unnamed protein product [Paramecium octaurelia]